MEKNEVLGDYGSRTVIDATGRFGSKQPPGPPLQPPGGGGTFDGMEGRVAKLEADVGHIQTDVAALKDAVRDLGKDVSQIRVDLATVTERVAHLPSKGFIVRATVVALGLIAALIVFQGNVQRFVGAPQSTAATAPPPH